MLKLPKAKYLWYLICVIKVNWNERLYQMYCLFILEFLIVFCVRFTQKNKYEPAGGAEWKLSR